MRDDRIGLTRLGVETAAVRAAGRLSRLAGRGGGTTLPGKILATVDPRALGRLARRLPLGTVLVCATNGKTTTARIVDEIIGPRLRLAHNRAGANLASGVLSALLDRPDAELGLFEVDEAALPYVAVEVGPHALCLGNLSRDQLDRYGELESIAERWRDVVARLPAKARLIANVDDPLVADIAWDRVNAVRIGLDDPAVAREHLPHAADSTSCLACGARLAYRPAYVGHLGAWSCPKCGRERPSLDVAARAVELHGLTGSSFELATPQGVGRVDLALPGLYNVYNALTAASLALVLGASLDEVTAGISRVRPAFGRFERIRSGDRDIVLLLVKNPAGANEAVRTLVCPGSPGLVVMALNDDIADGRDVSWIWDVDFEPLLAGLDRVVATGSRAHELALRCKYGGFDPERIEVVPSLAAALDRGLALSPPGGELVVLATYTAMLGLRRIAADRGLVRPFWEVAT